MTVDHKHVTERIAVNFYFIILYYTTNLGMILHWRKSKGQKCPISNPYMPGSKRSGACCWLQGQPLFEGDSEDYMPLCVCGAMIGLKGVSISDVSRHKAWWNHLSRYNRWKQEICEWKYSMGLTNESLYIIRFCKLNLNANQAKLTN